MHDPQFQKKLKGLDFQEAELERKRKEDEFFNELIRDTEEHKKKKTKVFSHHEDSFKKAKNTSQRAHRESKKVNLIKKETIELSN